MPKTRNNGRALSRAVTMAGLVAASLFVLAEGANAGECPADKIAANAMTPGATAPQGVTDTVLASIDLSKEAVKLKDRQMRLRRLEVQPGGVVPWHSHGDRPAIIYMVQGTMTEYSSNCSVPIEHRAGEVAMESVGLAHWWKNTGDSVAVLLSADILHMAKEDGHVM